MKAQSLSINTIIIAALGLIVLIVMVLIFTGRIQLFNTTTEDCNARGGECSGSNGCDIMSEVTIKNTNCEKERKGVCCVKMLKEEQDKDILGPIEVPTPTRGGVAP